MCPIRISSKNCNNYIYSSRQGGPLRATRLSSLREEAVEPQQQLRHRKSTLVEKLNINFENIRQDEATVIDSNMRPAGPVRA